MKFFKTNKKIKLFFYIFFICSIITIFNNNYLNDHKTNNTNIEKDETVNYQINENIKIHFIDVGQGDSIFIELPNNETMLIDAGESSKEEVVSEYINTLGYNKINYVIGTHPHSDHIGGLAHIINSFNIEKIYMPKALSTSKTYENLLNTIYKNNKNIITAKAGIKIIDEDNLKINILAPNNNNYSNLNNYSVVIKINYKSKSFLFMGDAEILSENEILTDVSADIIKIGHHGSDTSSSESFLSKVNPKYAIIMVGENNKYNHPNQTILDRLERNNIITYRTDLNGNIVITSDGNEINVEVSR